MGKNAKQVTCDRDCERAVRAATPLAWVLEHERKEKVRQVRQSEDGGVIDVTCQSSIQLLHETTAASLLDSPATSLIATSGSRHRRHGH